MFLIKYEILDDERQMLREINSLEEIESELFNVRGQLELTFNNSKDGFVDNEIPYSGEPLITWFSRLNEVLFQLMENSFIEMELPASYDMWYEFKIENEDVLVSEVRVEDEDYIEEFIVSTPKKQNEVLWEECISKDELYCRVLDVTNNFIKDILMINGLFSQTNEVKQLKELYLKVKKYNDLKIEKEEM